MQHMASRWQCDKEIKSVEQQQQNLKVTKWAGRNGWKVVLDWSAVHGHMVKVNDQQKDVTKLLFDKITIYQVTRNIYFLFY